MKKGCGCGGGDRIDNAEPLEGIPRILGIADGGVSFSLLHDVQPGVRVLDMDTPEFYYLKRTMRYALGIQLAAGAADPTFRFINPAASNTLAVIEYAAIQNLSGATNIAGMSVYNSVLGALISAVGVNLDTRQPITGGPLAHAVSLQQGSTVAPAPIWGRSITNNGLVSVPAPIVVVPGTSVEFVLDAAAVAAGFEMIWRERRFFPEERRTN